MSNNNQNQLSQTYLDLVEKNAKTPVSADERFHCIYIRTSTTDQMGGAESQLRAAIQFCEQNNISRYEVFTDTGISGAKSSRPALDRMMALVREGRVKGCIVYSFSRYARSVMHLLSALEEMKSNNTEFISVTERIDTSSSLGRAFFGLISILSQLEREILRERVVNGLNNARAKGVRIGRVKTRNSELIRALLAKGLSQRVVADLASCSNGSVSLEKRAIKLEKLAAEKKKLDEEKAAQLTPGNLVFDLPPEQNQKIAA